MTRLFLIRHGEAAAAWGGSEEDPGLSGAGREQAVAAAEALIELGPLALLTSPMRRCRETAAPFERLANQRAAIEARVSEVPTPVGVADRPTWLQSNFPWRGGPARAWATLDPALRDWRQTLLDCVLELQQDTAVFSHFIAINTVVGAAMSRADTIVCKPNYASITELEVSPRGLRLVRLGSEMMSGEVR